MKYLISRYLRGPTKILAVFIFLIGFGPNHSHGSNFRTVEDFLTSGQKMDLFTTGQVTNRCAGLFGAIGRFLPSGKDKDDMITLSSKFLETSLSSAYSQQEKMPQNKSEKRCCLM